MFTQIFFLIILVLMTELAPQGGLGLSETMALPLIWGLGAYLLSLCLIALQNMLFSKRRRRHWILILTNLKLIIAIAICLFLCRMDLWIPGGNFGISLTTLTLYFFGLFIFSLTTHRSKRATMRYRPIRFLLPFSVPFLLFQGFETLGNGWISKTPSFFDGMIILFLSLGFLGSAFCLIPYLIQKMWGCKPLPLSPLLIRLDTLCKKAKFRHGGMMSWSLMQPTPTAAILGVFPRFRYVLFTPRLLEVLSPEAIEAVLAHEMGHSKHKHLLIYPWILLTILVFSGWITDLFSEGFLDWLALQDLLSPSIIWSALEPLAVFIPYVLLLALFFRLIFGHFSRLFERQADLYPLALGVPLDHMSKALDELAISAGNIHQEPSWHHGSIAKRIAYLNRAKSSPKEPKKHNKRVRRNLFILGVVSLIIFPIVIAPFFPNTVPMSTINNVEKSMREKISFWITSRQRKILSHRAMKHLGDQKETPMLLNTLKKSFTTFGGARFPGIAKFYTAEVMWAHGQPIVSSLLLLDAFQQFDFSLAKKPLKDRFLALTFAIVEDNRVDPSIKTRLQTIAKAKLNYEN